MSKDNTAHLYFSNWRLPWLLRFYKKKKSLANHYDILKIALFQKKKKKKLTPKSQPTKQYPSSKIN